MQVVKLGSRGEAVRLCQERLKAKGFYTGSLDGDFGPKTDAVVRQFQAAHALKADGIVGDRSWALLLSVGEVVVPPVVVANQGALLLEQVRAGLATSGHPEVVRQKILSVLTAAIGDLGKVEVPDGSNAGPQIGHLVDGYNVYWKIPSAAALPWCGMAVASWIRIGLILPRWSAPGSILSGHPMGRWLGSVGQIEEWGKAQSITHDPMGAIPGQIFTMSREGSGSDPAVALQSGHTGLIVGVDGTGVVTIEGNTSNKVLSRRREKLDLRFAISWWDAL